MFDPRLRLRRGSRGSPPDGDATGSGGGTTVRVGSVNQTANLMYGSMVMRLNTFDFKLKNPATAPVLGDMVYVLEPAWDGQIVSVSWDDIPVGSDRFYSVTATNAKVAVLSTSSINLSDTPDLASSWPYSDLHITYSQTDSGNKTQGTCTVKKGEGLWPLQTFTLTSAHFGLVAQSFTCSNVTVTWPLDRFTRWFDIEFGDALLGLTQLPVDTGGLSTEGDGTTSLRDPLGNLIFNSATGFGSRWRRFLISGVYNGDFEAGPPDPSNVIINVTNPVPSWSFLRIGGTGINATWVPDSLEGSGHVLRFTMSPGVADDEIVFEQLLPINASRNRAYAYNLRAYFFNGSASASPGGLITLEQQFMRNDGSTTTGASSSATGAAVTAVDLVTGIGSTTPAALAPADAYFVRVRVGFKRDTALVGTTASVDLAEVRLEGGIGTTLVIPDDTDPATNGYGYITQTNKLLDIKSSHGTGASPNGTIRLRTAKLDFSGTPMTSGGAGFPVTPAPVSGDNYWRTDYNQWFFYDGTRWLSTTLYHVNLLPNAVALPIAATANAMHRTAMPPLSGGSDIWFLDSKVVFYVAGGTALGASHKWVGQIQTNPAVTTIDTININSGASDTFRTATAAINVSGVASTQFELVTQWTKTGTPGTLYIWHVLTYRVVAT